MAPPNKDKFTAGQTEQLKNIISGIMGDKMGLGAERMRALGGFMELFDEGSKIYDSKKEAILNTGKLLESVVGPEGLVNRLSGLSESTFDFFGRIDEGVAATNSLVQGLRSFVMTQKENQSELVQQAALFKALGVQMSDFNAVIDSARLGFDMSAESAAKLSRQVANIGNATGVGMKEAMANFSRAQQSMAYDSGKLMDNFRALQLTSAQTGVGFDRLTSAFGESMDTFEGSASKAGTLNAILGRSVFNSIDLLGKTEAQRVETIIQGIKRNVNVEALGKNKFQLKAISKGLGLSPDETRRLLTGQMTVDEALAQKEKDDPRAAATKRMAELLKDTNVGLEDFHTILKGIRTAQSNATVGFNAMMRSVAQTGLAKIEGLNIETPTQMFETIQQTLRELARRGQAEEAMAGAERIASIMGEEGYKDVFNIKSNLTLKERKEKGMQLFRKLGDEVLKLQGAIPESPDQRSTTGEQSRNTALLKGKDLQEAELKANRALATIISPFAELLKNVSNVAINNQGLSLQKGATFIFEIAGKPMKAVIKEVVRDIKVGDPNTP